MTNEVNHLDKLKKLKALADRGIGGEKDNAAFLLQKLCNKYGVSLDEVTDDDHKELYWFVHKQGSIYRKLLNQCMYKIFGESRPVYKRGKERILGAYCTSSEAIEIEMDYDFYLRTFKEDMERLYHMFIQKNRVFPVNSKSEESSEATEITDEDMALYNGLKRHSRTLQIK